MLALWAGARGPDAEAQRVQIEAFLNHTVQAGLHPVTAAEADAAFAACGCGRGPALDRLR
jgi:hypothetical protein